MQVATSYLNDSSSPASFSLQCGDDFKVVVTAGRLWVWFQASDLLCGVCMFSLCGFSAGSLASPTPTVQKQTCQVNWEVSIVVYLFVSMWLCDELVTCTGRHLAIVPWQLGVAPSDPLHPDHRKKQLLLKNLHSLIGKADLPKNYFWCFAHLLPWTQAVLAWYHTCREAVILLETSQSSRLPTCFTSPLRAANYQSYSSRSTTATVM